MAVESFFLMSILASFALEPHQNDADFREDRKGLRDLGSWELCFAFFVELRSAGSCPDLAQVLPILHGQTLPRSHEGLLQEDPTRTFSSAPRRTYEIVFTRWRHTATGSLCYLLPLETEMLCVQRASSGNMLPPQGLGSRQGQGAKHS